MVRMRAKRWRNNVGRCLLTSTNFRWVVADVGGWVDEPAELPFEGDVGVAGADPDEETVADLGGTDAGEEEVGAGSLSVLPCVIPSTAVHAHLALQCSSATCAILG